MSSFRTIEFSGYKLCINDETYEPAEDTELILDILEVNKGQKVVEVGSGSGILSIRAASLGGKVISIDINPFAVESTLCSIKLNNVENDINVINCNMLSCIRETVFDVAIFNPPYLPYEEYNSWISYSWSGGKSGVDVLIRFLKQVKAKKIYTVYSSLSDEDKLLDFINKNKIKISKKVEKVYDYERIIAIQLDAQSNFSRA
ncbi:HemK2/MTQ2 family protein methyltransferase [Acidianus manzaensis]|uniref:Methyltransferase n=1 Tax=Acidianus manzaensis TaxID=282676 RepID=A0A1W6K036_9CREN|nr:HemK2/MTQ2 family protein methyltransferase [Acidianus manzaensis]ARM75903.1 methyltransferase [Acidianus manzaensis]